MKIAIIGGGWLGCHLAYIFKKKHIISIFEKENLLFTQTSYNNQNRLHMGYHYARHGPTRELCKKTYKQFLKNYGFLTNHIRSGNLYCISDYSILDYPTYLQIFKGYGHKVSDCEFLQTEGCISTNEMYINFHKAHEFFNNELENISILNTKINDTILQDLSNQNDLVINCSNNCLTKINNSFFEPTLTLLYSKIKDINFGALTFVDGNFFSIYPYKDEVFSVTDVGQTPIAQTTDYMTAKNMMDSINTTDINYKKQLIEDKILNYYPNFLNHFKYKNYFTSLKTKIKSTSDSRYPQISIHNNIISCFTGKIQGIFVVEQYIKNWLKQ